MSDQRLEATVRGRVQGVGFRWFVVTHARRLGAVGWVANQPDGTVRLVAEGPPDVLEELQHALADGPPGAEVSAVDTRRGAASGGFDRFSVRASGHAGD